MSHRRGPTPQTPTPSSGTQPEPKSEEPEPEVVDGKLQYEDDAAFERAKREDALVAESFSTPEKVRERIEYEIGRDVTRPHVIAILNERLDEVRADD